MFSVCIDAPKGSSCYPKMACFSFTYVVIKTIMLLECSLKKLCYIKTNINFRDLGTDFPQSVGSRSLFYLMSIMPKMFIEDSSNLKRPKNLKSINNTTMSYLVSCRVKFLKKILEILGRILEKISEM